MRSCILCVHIETSSLWAEFVNKNRYISVRLVSEEVKSIKFDNFVNSHNSFQWPEYVIDFLCERWIPCQAVISVLCLHYRPETVHCSTKDANTSEITFLALHPCFLVFLIQKASFLWNDLFLYIENCMQYTISINKKLCNLCLSVCLSDHNSGTPGPILIGELGRSTGRGMFLAWF